MGDYTSILNTIYNDSSNIIFGYNTHERMDSRPTDYLASQFSKIKIKLLIKTNLEMICNLKKETFIKATTDEDSDSIPALFTESDIESEIDRNEDDNTVFSNIDMSFLYSPQHSQISEVDSLYTNLSFEFFSKTKKTQ